VLSQWQSPDAVVVVPSHCFAVAGPEQTWPIPHCVPSAMVPHAGHFPQSHFPLVHVHVVVPPPMSLHTGASPCAVAPSVVQVCPLLTSVCASLVPQVSHCDDEHAFTITIELAARTITKSHFML